MLVLFRMKYLVVAFALGGLCGMWSAFSAKGCGEYVLNSRPIMQMPAPTPPPVPFRSW